MCVRHAPLRVSVSFDSMADGGPLELSAAETLIDPPAAEVSGERGARVAPSIPESWLSHAQEMGRSAAATAIGGIERRGLAWPSAVAASPPLPSGFSGELEDAFSFVIRSKW